MRRLHLCHVAESSTTSCDLPAPQGLNALLATASTAVAPPVIAATWLRRGNARSSRGAAALVTEALQVIRRCGASGVVILRADSAFYTRAVVTAAQKAVAGSVSPPRTTRR